MRRLFAILLLITGPGVNAQTKDANLWTSAGFGFDLTKKIAFSYEMQTRFYKNVTALDSYINEIGVKYEPLKRLDLSLDYRYSRKNQESYYEGVNRIALNVSYGYKFDGTGIRLKTRIRYQVPFNYLGIINDAIYPDNRNVLRFKIGVKYTPTNLKKIEPFANYEFYKAISPKNIYNPIDSYRFNVGVSFNLPKRHSVDLFYLFEKEYRSSPQVNHVYGIQYNYDLFKDPMIKEKKKD